MLSAGDVDTSFGAGGMIVVGRSLSASGRSILPVANERFLLMVSEGTTLNRRAVVERYNADGSLDTTFGGGDGRADYEFSGIVHADVGADGKIIVADYTRNGMQLVRLIADGSTDTTFGSNGVVDLRAVAQDNAYVFDLAVQDDGRIAIIGSQGYLYRLDAAGAMDSTFTPFVFSYGSSGSYGGEIEASPDGKLILGGTNLRHTGRQFDFVRLTNSGAVDATFGDDGYYNGFVPTSFAVRDDGQIIVAWYADNRSTLHVQRLNSDGDLDSPSHAVMAFGNLKGRTRFAHADDGKTVVYSDTSIARLNVDGSVDDSFGRVVTHYWEGSMNLHGAVVQNDGDVIVAAVPGAITTTARLYRLHGSDVPENSFYDIVGETLTITGTNDNDGFYVEPRGGDIIMQRQRAFGRVVSASAIAKLDVSLLDGDDKLIVYNTSMPVTVSGGEGADLIRTADGIDSIFGDGGRDSLLGGAGNDQIFGGASRDYIDGQSGDDEIFGQGGNDIIRGGVGNDTLHGNAGADTFCTRADGGIDEVFGDGGDDLAVADDDDIIFSAGVFA